MDMKTEAALVCMIVSNPTGKERPQGWQKRVNDLIRAQRDALDAVDNLAEALAFYADLSAEGPWHLPSEDYGKRARSALAAYEETRK